MSIYVNKDVWEMSADEAQETLNRLDGTPSNKLPGAYELGTRRAWKAYQVYRSLLVTRIAAGDWPVIDKVRED